MGVDQFIKDQKSQVLIISMVIMVLVFTLGAGLLYNSRTSRDISGLEVEIKKAHSQAASGIAIVKSLIAQSPCGSIPDDETYNIGDGTVSVVIDEGAQTITATGRSGKSSDVIVSSFETPEFFGGGGANFLKEITIFSLDTHGIASDLLSFPVLVKVTLDSDNVAQSDGGDILFMNFDFSTQLNHEIESYDSSTGDLVAWVNIPTLTETEDTIIYLLYGNTDPSFPNQWNIEAVWDENYKGVWHMAEDPTISTDGDCAGIGKEICDSTSNNNDLDDDNTPVAATGVMNGAVAFEHEDGDGLKGDDDSSLDIQGDITIEAWIFPSFFAHHNFTVLQKWRNSVPDDGGQPYFVRFQASHSDHMIGRIMVQFCATDAIDEAECDRSHGSYGDIIVNEWNYITIMYDMGGDNNIRQYKEGDILMDTEHHLNGMYDSDRYFQIGLRGGGQSFEGIIDEVRISNIARSVQWTKASYINQDNVLNFMSFDAEEACN